MKSTLVFVFVAALAVPAAWANAPTITPVPAAGAPAAVGDAGPVPAPLVGTWTRTVTAADVKRVHATLVHAGMICTLTIRKGGIQNLNASIICKGGSGLHQGFIDAAGPNQVHIKLIEPDPDVYSWKVSGQRLTLTKVKDTADSREAVFWGIWQRK